MLSKIIPFLFIPYLTRYLGVEGIGELNYLLAIISALYIIINLSSDGAFLRYYFNEKEFKSSIVLTSILIYQFFFLVIALLFLELFDGGIYKVLVLCAYSQVLFNLLGTVLQCNKKAKEYFLYEFFFCIFSIIFTVTFFEKIEISVNNRIFSIILSCMLLSVFLIFFKSKKILNKINFDELTYSLKYIFIFGFPLLLHNFSFYAKGQLDRYLIFNKFSASELGIYSTGYLLASIIIVIYMSLNKAFTPYLFESIKNGKTTQKKVIKYSLYLTILTPLITFIVFLIPEGWFIWFLGLGFKGVKYFVVVFVLGLSLHASYLLLSNYLFYLGKTKIIALLNFSSVIIYLIFLFTFGMISIFAVPFSLFISNIFLIVSFSYVIYKIDLKEM